MNGTIFDIQRFSIHDGPGIRTTVFLKGCPLRCAWCQNPEGLEKTIHLWNFDNLCVGCGKCIANCPNKALVQGEGGKPTILHDRCSRCGRCVDECLYNAMALDGLEIDSENLVERLLADAVFFASSGGGVTFSGGEPLTQAKFVLEVATGLHRRGFHTAVETSMEGEWEDLESLIRCIDYFQVDVKIFNPDSHCKATGRDNTRILDNLRLLAGALRGSDRLKVRIPVIPGYSADDKNLSAIARHVATVDPDIPVELLNFNPLATAKYRRMRKQYPLADVSQAYPDSEIREKALRMARSQSATPKERGF